MNAVERRDQRPAFTPACRFTIEDQGAGCGRYAFRVTVEFAGQFFRDGNIDSAPGIDDGVALFDVEHVLDLAATGADRNVYGVGAIGPLVLAEGGRRKRDLVPLRRWR